MDKHIKKGDSYDYKFQFNQDHVIKFAEASGDYNPIHLDSDYAQRTIFKRTIIHGFLGGSVFSKVFGTMFPGEGTIYLKQDLSFFKPMFVGQEYLAKFIVSEVFSEKNRALIITEIVNLNDEIVIKGEALIKHPKIY